MCSMTQTPECPDGGCGRYPNCPCGITPSEARPEVITHITANTVEYSQGTGLGELISAEEGRRRLKRYGMACAGDIVEISRSRLADGRHVSDRDVARLIAEIDRLNAIIDDYASAGAPT